MLKKKFLKQKTRGKTSSKKTSKDEIIFLYLTIQYNFGKKMQKNEDIYSLILDNLW